MIREILGRASETKFCYTFVHNNSSSLSVTVVAWSKARTVFARSDAGIVGSNPTQGMDVWCEYAFILCLCCPLFR
jgi:hypothetical protein